MLLTPDQLLGPLPQSIALIGPPKTGKTESIASMLKVFDATHQPNRIIEHFDLDEDGSISLIRKVRELDRLPQLRVHRFRRQMGEKVKVDETPNRFGDEAKDFINEFNGLYDLVNGTTGEWKVPETAPGVVCIDSMTSLQDLLWNFILSERQREIGAGPRTQGGTGPGPVTFDEWSLLRSKIVEVVKAAKGLPCHSIFCFHLDYRTEEAGRQQKITQGGQVVLEPTYVAGSYHHVPMIVGQLAFSILKEFSVCLESTFQLGKYEWKVVPDERSRAIGSRAKPAFKAGQVAQDFSLVL